MPTARAQLVALASLVLALAVACQRSGDSLPPADEIAVGTWGTDGAGLIAADGAAHLHIGCTFGDFALPVSLDGEGRFRVAGSYMLRAYPVAVGPSLPASFSGLVRGKDLTVGVVVNDTTRNESVTLGPVTLELGREPRLGPCPICKIPPAPSALR
jgi:hypothetical protein